MTFFGKSAFCSTPKNVVSHPCGIWLLLQQCKLTHCTTILRHSIGLEPARNNYYTFPVYTASALEQLCVVSQHFFRTLAVVILTVAMYTSWHWTHRHIRQAFLLVALRDCFILLIHLSDSSLKSQWCYFDQDSGICDISCSSEGDLDHSSKWSEHLSVPGAVQNKWDDILEQWHSPLRLTSCNLYYSDWTGCWHWIQH